MEIQIRRICVPTDFSEPAQQALDSGAVLASKFGADLHVLHVLESAHATVTHPDFTAHGEIARAYFNRLEQADVDSGGEPPAGREDVDRAARAFLHSLEETVGGQFDGLPRNALWDRLTIVRAIRYGNTVEEICRYARKLGIDLLALGTRGRSGLAHFLTGSVAERVVRFSPCPVLTIGHLERGFVIDD